MHLSKLLMLLSCCTTKSPFFLLHRPSLPVHRFLSLNREHVQVYLDSIKQCYPLTMLPLLNGSLQCLTLFVVKERPASQRTPSWWAFEFWPPFSVSFPETKFSHIKPPPTWRQLPNFISRQTSLLKKVQSCISNTWTWMPHSTSCSTCPNLHSHKTCPCSILSSLSLSLHSDNSSSP